ncbi:MAG: single-stranded DNA-binding protein [Puniceicoccales bacterium]|jgi:single-strand DNA-binding protein|nr:single-stranded DNA-binding protein [Puniceicoccales bacterium]
MASFNRVILLGNLSRDPDLRVTQQGASICKFTVATSRQSKLPDGTIKEETAFVDVDAFGKQAEIIGKYFTKGRPILVEGRLRLDQWETQSGEKRSKLGVVLENFQFVDSRSDVDRPVNSPIDDDARSGAKGLVEDLSHGKQRSRAANVDVQIDESVPF